jgi:hypothetical protein
VTVPGRTSAGHDGPADIAFYPERRKFVRTLYQGTASAVPKTFRQKLLSSHSAGATPLAAAPAECITNEVVRADSGTAEAVP